MIETLATHATQFFEQWHYYGAFGLMAMESMILPVPSEVVMPPLGMLVSQGKLSAFWVVAVTTAASVFGSLVSYAMGYWGGRPVVLKAGKYLLLNERDLAWTEKWFHAHGGVTIFVGRFIPVVRHLISIPAGMGRMPLLPFIAYTLVGATLWNAFLLWLGIKLNDHWQVILKYRQPLDWAVIAGLLVIGAWFIHSHLLKKRPDNVMREP